MGSDAPGLSDGLLRRPTPFAPRLDAKPIVLPPRRSARTAAIFRSAENRPISAVSLFVPGGPDDAIRLGRVMVTSIGRIGIHPSEVSKEIVGRRIGLLSAVSCQGRVPSAIRFPLQL